jgi:hypothetical protein
MEERIDTVSRRNDMPVMMRKWEKMRSRKREPRTLADVVEKKNLRMKRVKNIHLRHSARKLFFVQFSSPPHTNVFTFSPRCFCSLAFLAPLSTTG